VADQETLQQAFDAALAELKGKERKLVIEYLRDLHQRNAAIRAGYSEKTADVQASQILRKLKVRAAVNAGLALYAMPADEVLARLTSQARGSMADLLNDAGDIDLEQARERGVLHLVKARGVTKEGERIELYDAQAALALLGKHHKLFTDKVEHTGADGQPLFKVYEKTDAFDPDDA
jgi:phage terminase small subunit